MRTIAVGDIHGCAKALRTMIELIAPQPDDTVIFLGDYVDRGPNSRDVIDQILTLQKECNVVPLRGNHEIMLLGILMSGLSPDLWLNSGGRATVTSYGGSLEKIPASHMQFLCDLRPFHETENAIFVHANYLPDRPMSEQPDQRLYWDHLSGLVPRPHESGKRVFVGHTPQASGEILDHGHMVCIDTCCFGGRWLTALDVDSGDVWQTNFRGHARRQRMKELQQAVRRWWKRRSS